MKKSLFAAAVLAATSTQQALASDVCFEIDAGHDSVTSNVRYSSANSNGQFCLEEGKNFQYNVVVNKITGPWINASTSDINNGVLDASSAITTIDFDFTSLVNTGVINEADLESASVSVRYTDLKFTADSEPELVPFGVTRQWNISFSGFTSPWDNVSIEGVTDVVLNEENAFDIVTVNNNSDTNNFDLKVRYARDNLNTIFKVDDQFALPEGTNIQFNLELNNMLSPWYSLKAGDSLSIEPYVEEYRRDPDTGDWIRGEDNKRTLFKEGHIDLITLDLEESEEGRAVTDGTVNVRYTSLSGLVHGDTFYGPVGKTFQWQFITGGTSGGWRTHEIGADGDLKLKRKDFCWVDIKAKDTNGNMTDVDFADDFKVNIRYRNDLSGENAQSVGDYFLWPQDRAFQWNIKTANGAVSKWYNKKGCGDLMIVQGSHIQPVTLKYGDGFSASSKAQSYLRYLSPSTVSNGDSVWLPVGYNLQARPDLGSISNSSWQAIKVKSGKTQNQLIWTLNGSITKEE